MTSLSEKANPYYLAGGTALSLFYLGHRASYDLDFFTQTIDYSAADTILEHIQHSLSVTAQLAAEQRRPELVPMRVYHLQDPKTKENCKIDFVQDPVRLLSAPDRINGIDILSKEDIYYRKIYTVSGASSEQNITGKDIRVGGRQEAKDFFDLYFLSTVFIPLSEFITRYADFSMVEGLIYWYRTFDRTQMKTDLLELITAHTVDFREMDRHIHDEIQRLIREQIKEKEE
ncbi:MAG: nucleotidyl transferase AbiEii/AbiGii toxin family protein [Candidatus Omnitrophota bacterium]